MTKKEFANLVKGMKAIYADPKFIEGDYALEVWYNFFKDDDYMVVQAAIQKYMANSEFPPTVAGIRKYLVDITDASNDMSEGYAWALVYKAICNSNYSAKDEFDKLPDVCKKAVGAPDNLREWAMLSTDEVNTVIQSNFLKGFRMAKKQQDELASLPCQMREKIESIAAAHTPLISKGGYIDD